LIGLTDGNDDLCDDESVSFSYDEFVKKGLWIAGQENAYKTTPNRAYVRFPKTALGLSQVQVDKCIKASEFWYQKYMNTIIMKDLQYKIAPKMLGYKEIRQRSAGRYDMQIPVFDTDEFSFLHDLDAPWMTFVRKCLANSNVALIHKGIILSTNRSERQKYHTDGIHLDSEEHQPCYAVNVFFYLIDIDEKNGGTEFHMGSHKLKFTEGDECTVSQVFLESKCINLNI
jgi:hypothetical protein